MRSKKLHHLAITLHDDSATLAEPSAATDGGSLASWKPDGFAPRDAAVIVKKGATAAGDPTLSGAELRGYDATDDEWRAIGQLNDGSAIACTDDTGFEQRVFDVGTFDRLDVVGMSTDKVTVVVKPIEDIAR